MWQNLILLFGAISVVLGQTVTPSITLPNFFSDYAVLQTNMQNGARAFLWGWSSNTTSVTVRTHLRNVVTSVNVDRYGGWKVMLNPMAPTGAQEETIDIYPAGFPPPASPELPTAWPGIRLQHIAYGDVYFCSGQSNMVFPLKVSLNSSREAATAAAFPFFRTLTVKATSSAAPLAEPALAQPWTPITPQNILDFSAVCYMTAREIVQIGSHLLLNAQRPVGLIASAYGGTAVEWWTPHAGLENCGMKTVQTATQSTQLSDGHKVPPQQQDLQIGLSELYNAMVAPFTGTVLPRATGAPIAPIGGSSGGYTIRAALWYQGERNAREEMSAAEYTCLFQNMIEQWRLAFGFGQFPFLFVQLAPSIESMRPGWDSVYFSNIREGQLVTLPPGAVPDVINIGALGAGRHPVGVAQMDTTGMAVALDVGGASSWGMVHPVDKPEISRRLAFAALHTIYGFNSSHFQWQSPTPVSVVRRGDSSSVVVTLAAGSYEGNKITGARNCTVCCSKGLLFEERVAGNWSLVPAVHTIPSSSGLLIVEGVQLDADALRWGFTNFVECTVRNGNSLGMTPWVMSISRGNTTQPYSRTFERVDLQRGIAPVSRDKELLRTTFVDGAARLPPMGYNTWNFYHCNVDENALLAVSEAMEDLGLKDAGYEFVNLDDCWMAPDRSPLGEIQPDPTRFPRGMTVVASELHRRGFKFGLYTAQHAETCQQRAGAYLHELQDAATYCSWGVDFLKIDQCVGAHYPVENTSWILFNQGFELCAKNGGAQIVQSCESCGNPECGAWVGDVCNMWRTSTDIQANWASVYSNAHSAARMARFSKPGNWNDPDMLQIGNPGLTLAEQRSHMALWCCLAAPLLIGTDLTTINNDSLAVLLNKALISVNQDPRGIGGTVITSNATSEVWVKPLVEGIFVVLLNTGDHNIPAGAFTVSPGVVGCAGPVVSVVSAWRGGQVVVNTEIANPEVLLPHDNAALLVRC